MSPWFSDSIAPGRLLLANAAVKYLKAVGRDRLVMAVG
jgi:hypothetical protein